MIETVIIIFASYMISAGTLIKCAKSAISSNDESEIISDIEMPLLTKQVTQSI